MSAMSDLSIELLDLQDAALQQADELRAVLQNMSDMFWQNGDDEPIFRATTETLRALRAIEAMLATPIQEIEAAA